MSSFSCFEKIQIRYSEIDAMGILHHKNYWVFFEMLRIKWLEENGYDYSRLEANGLFLPVIQAEIKYLKAIKMNDIILVKSLVNRPSKLKVGFEYMVYKNEQLCTTAKTQHVLVNEAQKPLKLPNYLIKILPNVSR